MNYPFKYIVKVYSDHMYCEEVSEFCYVDFTDAEKYYNDALASGARVFMYRIFKSDNLEL